MIPAFIAAKALKKMKGEDDDMADQRRYTSQGVGTMDSTGTFSPLTTGNNRDQGSAFFPQEDKAGNKPIMAKGGGTPPTPASPMQEAQAQIELERARAQLQQQQAQADRAREAAEKQARIDKARGIQSNAYNTAQGYAGTQIGARGFDQGLVDQYGLLDLYNSALDQTRMGIAEDDLNPMASYNTRTMFNDALDTALGSYRGDLNRQFRDIAPEDFAYNLFADSADDDILRSILDQNKSDAMSQIDAARARGQLNDVGYNRALQSMGQQEQAGWADLQDLGLGVLGGYRDELNAMRGGMLDRIGSASFSDPLDFGSFQGRLDQTVNDFNNRLSGDIYRVTQGKSFFDPSSIITGSGALQGFYNPTQGGGTSNTQQGTGNNPLLDAFTNGANNPQRTTGMNEVF